MRVSVTSPLGRGLPFHARGSMRPNPPPRQEARLDSIELSIFRHPTNFVEEGFQNVPYSAPSAPGAPQQRRQADEGLQAPTNTEPSGVPPFGEPTGGDAEDDRVPLIRKATEYAHSGMDPANARRWIPKPGHPWVAHIAGVLTGGG